MECPGFERLLEYLQRRTSTEESGLIEAHLSAGCERCAEDRRWYEQVAATAASDDSAEPPPWVLKRALRLFDRKRSERPFAAGLGELIASLVFDSLARPAAAGVRAGGPATRQLLYTAQDYNIDLQISAVDPAAVGIVGQILKQSDERFESVSAVSLTLFRHGEKVSSTVTSPSGEFAIQGVSRGAYELHIETPDVSITLSGLPADTATQ